jgi:hypothetical protein
VGVSLESVAGSRVAAGQRLALRNPLEPGPGAPRDAYLKLETIDYDALLERHVPILL